MQQNKNQKYHRWFKRPVVPVHNQSGIYSIKCNCYDAEYIGQTIRKITERFKEHRRHVNNNEIEKSSDREWSFFWFAKFEIQKWIYRVDKFYALNAFETFYINKNKNKELMNENDGPITNSIFSKYYNWNGNFPLLYVSLFAVWNCNYFNILNQYPWTFLS